MLHYIPKRGMVGITGITFRDSAAYSRGLVIQLEWLGK